MQWKLHLFELEEEMKIDPPIKYVLYQVIVLHPPHHIFFWDEGFWVVEFVFLDFTIFFSHLGSNKFNQWKENYIKTWQGNLSCTENILPSTSNYRYLPHQICQCFDVLKFHSIYDKEENPINADKRIQLIKSCSREMVMKYSPMDIHLEHPVGNWIPPM